MNYDTLIQWISHFGYAALFFALWLGIVGMPIPDEVIVMTGGAVSKAGLLHTLPAFLVTYLGVVSGISLGYFLGRFLGPPVLDKFRHKKNFGKYLLRSEELLKKYGKFALCFSYFFPFVRHLVPYLVGINKMPYRHYILYSYTTGFIWTLIFFVVGQYAGSHVQALGTTIYHYGLYAGIISIMAIPLILIFTNKKRSKV